jgi:hypothetical protein
VDRVEVFQHGGKCLVDKCSNKIAATECSRLLNVKSVEVCLQVVRSDCDTARPTDKDTMIGQMYQYIHACEICCYYEIA